MITHAPVLLEKHPSCAMVDDNTQRTSSTESPATEKGIDMSNKETIESALHIVEGKKENIDSIMDTVQQFFNNLHLEMEDWKISVEEFHEGTRVFVRFQIIIKKE
jgi:hypothetical protein